MADFNFMTPMAEGAAAAHELFRSYVDAGFTEDQALHIITNIATAGVQAGMAEEYRKRSEDT